MKASLPWRTAAYIGLAVLLLWTLFPFYWMAITGFKTNREINSARPTLWPTQFTTEHVEVLFGRVGFPLHFRNSVVIASATTVISIILGVMGAYALTRLRFRGRRLIGLSIIITYLVPPSLLFIPLFALLRAIGQTNSLQGLVLADLTLTLPFCTWLMIGYFRTMPRELEEAALVDGCDRIGALVRIMIPLAAPAIAVVTLFAFTLSWNEFLYAVVFASSRESMPLTAALANLRSQDVFFWGQMMSMSLLTAIPPVILYFVAQRWIIGGLAVGGVKG